MFFLRLITISLVGFFTTGPINKALLQARALLKSIFAAALSHYEFLKEKTHITRDKSHSSHTKWIKIALIIFTFIPVLADQHNKSAQKWLFHSSFPQQIFPIVCGDDAGDDDTFPFLLRLGRCGSV
jgi:uncharacterized membrane protein